MTLWSNYLNKLSLVSCLVDIEEIVKGFILIVVGFAIFSALSKALSPVIPSFNFTGIILGAFIVFAIIWFIRRVLEIG